MAVHFDWDPRKAQENRRKHDVGFDEASTCFADELALELDDALHPERLVLIGVSQNQRLLYVVHAVLETNGVVRIISARKTTRNERRRYEEG